MSELQPQPNQRIDDPLMAEHMAHAMDPHKTYASKLATEALSQGIQPGTLAGEPYRRQIMTSYDMADSAATRARKAYEAATSYGSPTRPDEPDYHFEAAAAIDPATGETETLVATHDHQTGERLTPWTSVKDRVVLAPKRAQPEEESRQSQSRPQEKEREA